MAKIAVLYCKKIKDHSCVACAKCHKAMAEKNGEYGRHDTIELVAMTDCGDCPGLCVPRVKLLSEITKSLERPLDAIHLGTALAHGAEAFVTNDARLKRVAEIDVLVLADFAPRTEAANAAA